MMHTSATFDAFTPDNNSYGEHDFYYDRTMEGGSAQPGQSREDNPRAHHHTRGGILSLVNHRLEPRPCGVPSTMTCHYPQLAPTGGSLPMGTDMFASNLQVNVSSNILNR
jgi:hypothetical protein